MSLPLEQSGTPISRTFVKAETMHSLPFLFGRVFPFPNLIS